ncbi:MAG TPA: hypothetical protein VFA76_00380 [Terriglobales bacterium]|nr:hypothetical protein [Terriglobales bacterium]
MLLLITVAAILVQGYHPGVEDAEIYLPGILKVLHPDLYPFNQGFFASHAHMTLFPNLIAWSVRISHIPLDYALLLWQMAAIFLLLLACWHIGRLCFNSVRAQWGGVILVAALLTIPVAGTSLYIMDQYLNTRSLSAPSVLFAIVNAIEHKWKRAGLWLLCTGLIHPLMVVFGLAYVAIVMGMEIISAGAPHRLYGRVSTAMAILILPMGLFPPMTQAYHEALVTREYFFLLRWQWYEWLGIFAPLVLLWWYQRIARRHGLSTLQRLSSALIAFGSVFFVISLIITVPRRFENLTLLQPMRALFLLYILLFVFTGGMLAEWVLKAEVWRWLLLFVPLCFGMWYAQRQLFPATPHLEWPWSVPQNPWVRSFLWIRDNTPRAAYFALDPDHMGMAGEDQHGFRAIAQRSMLADNLKDSGAVTMFPKLAELWKQEVEAEQGWKHFGLANFKQLNSQFGVDWVVVASPVSGLPCPYHNEAVVVCQIK